MKDIDEVRRKVAAQLKVFDQAFQKANICIFPQFIVSTPPYALSTIFNALEIIPQPYSPWNRYDLCICFEDETKEIINVGEYIDRASKLWVYHDNSNEWKNDQVKRFVNKDCKDISKRKVASVFQSVFGYALDIDPRVYEGKIVRKANENAAHDGEVLTGPITEIEYERKRDKSVYNVHVNNIEGDAVHELRIPWFGHVSPLLYHNQRPLSIRFTYKNTISLLEPITHHLESWEIEKVNEFCQAFGLEYGEIDCLRDRDTNRLYIVDVNKTPCSPPNGLSDEAWIEAATSLAVEFAKGYLLV